MPTAAPAPPAATTDPAAAAGPLTFPVPAEVAAALHAAGGAMTLRLVEPRTGAVFPLSPPADAAGTAGGDDGWDPDAEPLPTRAEVEARMGQTFGEALREAQAELDAGGGVSLEEHRRLRREEWAAVKARLAAERGAGA